MPFVVAVPLAIFLVSGFIAFILKAMILNDMAELDPERLAEFYRFDTRVVGKLFGFNSKKFRAFVKSGIAYGNQRLALKLRIYSKLALISAVSLFIAVAVTISITVFGLLHLI